MDHVFTGEWEMGWLAGVNVTHRYKALLGFLDFLPHERIRLDGQKKVWLDWFDAWETAFDCCFAFFSNRVYPFASIVSFAAHNQAYLYGVLAGLRMRF